MNILVARTDRLGDVMMALPSLDYLRQQFPDARIDFACNKYFHSLLRPFLEARRMGLADLPSGFAARAKFIKRGVYSAVLFLNTDASFLAAAWWAGVRCRVGALSRPPSFLWLNHGLRQTRSSAEKNEGRYSLDLAEHLTLKLVGTSVPATTPALRLEGDEPSRAVAAGLLRDAGVQDGERFILLHPGTGGTALNLSGEQYAEVAAALEEGFQLPLVLSQGPSPIDRDLVSAIRARYREVPVIEHEDLAVIREVLRRAELAVGPSTGPLHLAHYVGTKTLGLYDPTSAQKISRWGFWGGAGATEMHAPLVDCPGTKTCVGPRCPEFFCMATLDWAGLILRSGNALKETPGD